MKDRLSAFEGRRDQCRMADAITAAARKSPGFQYDSDDGL
jgi:hypothetical protein